LAKIIWHYCFTPSILTKWRKREQKPCGQTALEKFRRKYAPQNLRLNPTSQADPGIYNPVMALISSPIKAEEKSRMQRQPARHIGPLHAAILIETRDPMAQFVLSDQDASGVGYQRIS